MGLHGHLPSLGSCARRVGDVPRGSRYHLRRSRTTRRGRALLVCARLLRFLFISLKIERRFIRRVAHRVRPRESGCPIHKKHLLPVLVVWAPPRKKGNQQHTLNGNTSAAGAVTRDTDGRSRSAPCSQRAGGHGVCAPNTPSDTRALRRSGFKNKCICTVKETPPLCVYRPLVSCLSGPHAQVETENLKSEK